MDQPPTKNTKLISVEEDTLAVFLGLLDDFTTSSAKSLSSHTITTCVLASLPLLISTLLHRHMIQVSKEDKESRQQDVSRSNKNERRTSRNNATSSSTNKMATLLFESVISKIIDVLDSPIMISDNGNHGNTKGICNVVRKSALLCLSSLTEMVYSWNYHCINQGFVQEGGNDDDNEMTQSIITYLEHKIGNANAIFQHYSTEGSRSWSEDGCIPLRKSILHEKYPFGTATVAKRRTENSARLCPLNINQLSLTPFNIHGEPSEWILQCLSNNADDTTINDAPPVSTSQIRLAVYKFLARYCLSIDYFHVRKSKGYAIIFALLKSSSSSDASNGSSGGGEDDVDGDDIKTDGNSTALDVVTGENDVTTTPSRKALSQTSPLQPPVHSSLLHPLLWVIQAPFLESDEGLRQYAARNLGIVLLQNPSTPLLHALFQSNDEEKRWKNLPRNNREQKSSKRDLEESIVFRFFQFLERQLCQFCCFPQSQLSFTMTTPGGGGGGSAAARSSHTISSSYIPPIPNANTSAFQYSAICALSSLCQYANVSTHTGALIFENSLLRLVRFWHSHMNRSVSATTSSSYTTSSGSSLEASSSLSHLAFSEMTRCNLHRPLRHVVAQKARQSSFIPCLFSEILVPSLLAGDCTRGYTHLHTFIRFFLLSNVEQKEGTMAAAAVFEYVEEVLPIILPVFIIEKDYNAIRMCAGFRLHLQRKIQVEKKLKRMTQENNSAPPPQIGAIATAKKGEFLTTKQLNEAAKRMCVDKGLIEHIVPKLLLHHDRAPLVFLLTTVITREISLAQLLLSREQLILKNLIWELGGSYGDNSDESGEEHESVYETATVIHALKKAALICQLGRKKQKSAIEPPSSGNDKANADFKRNTSLEGMDSMDANANRAAGERALKKWIGSHCMYLLVNVVAYRWTLKPFAQKTQSIKCLCCMLQFVQPSEAPQYLPQIMSIVNMAMCANGETVEDGAGGKKNDQENMGVLRFLAVEALSKFVHVVLSHQVKTVGANLSNIVVSLFPVLETDHDDKTRNEYDKKATQEAVSLLESLVSGRVGRQLAPFFHSVPFLPFTVELEDVRNLLKSNGVDFDNLLTEASTQRLVGCTSSTMNDNVSVDSSTFAATSAKSEASSDMQAALYRRLQLLCNLMNHESVTNRRVVIRHATCLLRANRRLFQSLVESEEAASMRFLTVVNEETPGESKESGNGDGGCEALLSYVGDSKDDNAPNGSGGVVSTFVQRLQSRCVIENDNETRLALATLIGEVGAIDPNRLGELNATIANATEDGKEGRSGGGNNSDPHNYTWRLGQPPWKSQVARYALQLVTKHLVVALKAAPTSQDQHKIAFAIQELLVLLDAFAKFHGDCSQSSKPDVIDVINIDSEKELQGKGSSTDNGTMDAENDSSYAHTSTSKIKGGMNPWLVGMLDRGGVLEIVEPFWSTSYKQIDVVASKKPPFFQRGTSYYTWLSSWCRFMVERSNANEHSRWKDLFHACRSGIRSQAGLSVAEFLLPLLVLDLLCFGDESDERVVVQELRDVLSFRLHGGMSAKKTDFILNDDDSQRAVNAVFMVLDTLQIWAERETEERQRAVRGGSSGGKVPHSSAASTSSNKRSSMSTLEVCLWPSDQSIARIGDLLEALPLTLCAKAAAEVGMHARSMRYLEIDARMHIVSQTFDDTIDNDSEERSVCASYQGRNAKEDRRGAGGALAPLCNIDLALAQQLLGRLYDYDAMAAIAQESSRMGLSRKLLDQIRERELHGDWSGALQGYEQVFQLRGNSAPSGSNQNWANGQDEDLDLERGMLRSLLELGQLESVLNQVRGMLYREKNSGDIASGSIKAVAMQNRDDADQMAISQLLPSAAEAAWRLSRWSLLDDLVNDHRLKSGTSSTDLLDADAQYQIAIGRAMLGIHRGSKDIVSQAVSDAKSATMTVLSGAARESYARSYPLLLRLHCIREIENASDFLLNFKGGDLPTSETLPDAFEELARSDSALGWDWSGRLNISASDVVGVSAIVNVRLALSRFAKHSALEGRLWFTIGRRARKQGLLHISETSLAHADAVLAAAGKEMDCDASKTSTNILRTSRNKVQMQVAKLRHACGETSTALRMVEKNDICVRTLLEAQEGALKEAVDLLLDRKEEHTSERTKEGMETGKLEIFGRRLLQATEWLVEGGLKSGAEVMDRYRLVLRVCPKWEKAHFSFARYLDSLLEARLAAVAGKVKQQRSVDDEDMRVRVTCSDSGCQGYLLEAMSEYGKSLTIGEKHLYQTLPRLLTIWFDFTSIESTENSSDLGQNNTSKAQSPNKRSKYYGVAGTSEANMSLQKKQEEANSIMSNFVKSISPHLFYTALPQLVARVGHRDRVTVDIVKSILTRVLTKFPAQAMWGLAWLKHSQKSERAAVGEDIFRGAQRQLRVLEKMKMADLLVCCRSLFKFLIDLAKFQPKKAHARSFKVREWKGEVALTEFVPPVQAALSISSSVRSGSISSGNNEIFPAFVPRMRNICPVIEVMSSKARPKKVTVFAVPAGQKHHQHSSHEAKQLQPGDAGEMHFLVKQEAKGDLRKDARVQDLNNVINRLLSGSGGCQGRRQRRRLHLRTFSVICLSEDCGILEWVPNTDSFRNVVSKSYNPQAAPHSVRRRGKRIANFSDPLLRNSFQKCQDMYVKNGNLLKASALFNEICLNQYPPVMYWWFVQNFLDPHAWFEARTAFSLSAAVWSAVGHVIGLGDRHSENILIDTSCGECVHVDFDCIFDKGLNLPRPEVVPFRLTPNMVDAMGPTGWEGTYRGGLAAAMGTLRDNRDMLLSVLEPFLKDPVIDWKRQRAQQKQGKSGGENVEAKRSIKVTEGRLRGVYNLRNPNTKKIRRTDGYSVNHEDEMAHILPLSVEGQVHRMIAEATSSENLVQLYVGWMPWV